MTLTVDRADPFDSRPLGLVLLGLVVGALVTYVPRFLAVKIHKAQVDQLLKDNERASDTIHCLRAWVTDQHEAGVSDEALVPTLANVLKYAPPATRRAREDVRQALDANPLKQDSSFQNDVFCQAVDAALSEKMERSDFIDDEGKAVIPHPLRKWIAAIEQLRALQESLDRAQRRINRLPDASQQTVSGTFHAAKVAFEDAEGPDLAAVQTAVETLDQAIGEATPPDQRGIELTGAQAIVFSGSRLSIVTEAPPVPEEAALAQMPSLHRRDNPTLPILTGVTVALVIIVTVWTCLQLRATVYDVKAAFGTFDDYLALVTAAAGSGAAGGFVALVGIWSKEPQGAST